MTIYLDLVFFLNFFFDYMLLFAVSRLLKEKVPWYRILVGSLIGSFSIFFLFFSLTSFWLFCLKGIISIFMILGTFSFQTLSSFLKKVAYLYLVSIILGGGLYFLNIQFSYQNKGVVFYSNGLKINFLIILVSAPCIVFWYIKENLYYRNIYQNIYQVKVFYQRKEYDLKGYLDTGNQVRDPYQKRSILLVDENKIPIVEEGFIYVPYQSFNHHGVMKCSKVEKIEIAGKIYRNILIGFSKEPFRIENVDCIIPSQVKEDMND